MANFFSELADYMETQDATLDSLFVGVLPPDPTDAIVLLGLPGNTIGQTREITAMQFPRFQAYVRNANYASGLDMMVQVRDVLHGINDVSLTSWRILRCHAEQEGYPIGQDELGNYEFSINFHSEVHPI